MLAVARTVMGANNRPKTAIGIGGRDHIWPDVAQLGADSIGGIEAGAYRYAETTGDTWIPTWADDKELYVVSDDCRGFGEAKNAARNWMIHRLSGENPLHLIGATINTMDDYGLRNQPNSELGYGTPAAQDGRAWKANGITCIDGVIYVAISKHDYPWRNKQLTDLRQTAADASIIKSVDHGLHWTRSSIENYAHPMFPGRRFGAPFFITYGKNGTAKVHGADTYVYAVSNNGFWNNGDDLILGRVRRSTIANLSGDDWEFYRGNGRDGRLRENWSHDVGQATPILRDPGRVGMSAIQYIEPLEIYLLCQWYYPQNTFDGGPTIWSFRTAREPWGPWTLLFAQTFPEGYYNPAIAPKFGSADGLHQTILVGGDFRKQEWFYKLHVMPISLLPKAAASQ
jgi:hypothetical protein